MTVPTRLYKYEPLSLQALHNLKSQVIYFGSPMTFNDPYDCALTPNLRAPTDTDVEAIRQYYLHRDDLPAGGRAEFERLEGDALRALVLRVARNVLGKATSDFLRDRGVACFSELNDDLLMWSHYGGRYKGFCLEFLTSSEPFSKIKRVRYVPSLPEIDVRAVLVDRDFDPVSELFCTKSQAWAYEREWRGIHGTAGTEFCYEAEALTGVYFGPDIDVQSLEMICLILQGQNSNVAFWRGRRSTTEFRVLFEKFEYSSHLAAKTKGLL